MSDPIERPFNLVVTPPIAFDACVRALQVLTGVAGHFRAKGWPAELVAEAFSIGAATGALVTALEQMGVQEPWKFCAERKPEVLRTEKPR